PLRTASASRAVTAAYSAFDILPCRALEPSNNGSGAKVGVAYRTAILAFSAFASASAWVTALSDSLDPSVGTSRLVYIETSVSGWCQGCYSGSRNRCGPGVNPQLVHLRVGLSTPGSVSMDSIRGNRTTYMDAAAPAIDV